MKKTIEVERKVTKEIEVNLPYYYEQHLDHSVIYGRIEENRHVSVHVDYERFELEIEKRPPSSLGCYFTAEYASSRSNFEKALIKLKKAAESV